MRYGQGTLNLCLGYGPTDCNARLAPEVVGSIPAATCSSRLLGVNRQRTLKTLT